MRIMQDVISPSERTKNTPEKLIHICFTWKDIALCLTAIGAGALWAYNFINLLGG